MGRAVNPGLFALSGAVMTAFVVGLTGGIGSGKTTVMQGFNALGIEYVDADIVAREVVMPGMPALDQIAGHFGTQLINADGSLNRAALREHIFNHPADKAWLEQLLHPLIRQRLLQQLNALTSPYVLLVAPLLLENKLNSVVSRVLVVDLPDKLQRERAMARDNANAAQIDAIMAAQLSRTDRLAQADDIIYNDAGLEALTPQIAKLHQRYLELAKQR